MGRYSGSHSLSQKVCQHSCGFIQINILGRYGALRTIINHEGSHFENKLLVKLLTRYGVSHAMGLAYHPLSNGQAEIFTREIKNILEKIVNTRRRDWLVKSDDALWDYKTTYKSPIAMSPYRIIFGKPCNLHLELEYMVMWAIKKLNYDFQAYKERRSL